MREIFPTKLNSKCDASLRENDILKKKIESRKSEIWQRFTKKIGINNKIQDTHWYATCVIVLERLTASVQHVLVPHVLNVLLSSTVSTRNLI